MHPAGARRMLKNQKRQENDGSKGWEVLKMRDSESHEKQKIPFAVLPPRT